MSKTTQNDTIAAIATPIGQGALGIVRISGPEAFEIVDEIFSSKKGKPSSFQTHTVHYGSIISDGELIDNALLIVMREPATYTGENTVEITCHGGRLVLHKVLTASIKAGARPANPGEFTLRAFLNGKMDLSQAEAVQQLISAQNELAFKTASQQLTGKLSTVVENFRRELVDIAAEVEASIDFPEEDIEPATKKELIEKITSLKKGTDQLINTFADGKKIREGIKVVIVGKPNAGKSSLLNALLEQDRAIVTHIAGTTRDVLEESLICQGIALNVVDTAGIRKPKGVVEKEGVRRSHEALDTADLILFVVDTSIGITKDDVDVYRAIKNKKFIIVISKIDLAEKIDETDVAKQFNNSKIVKTSALKNRGIDSLKEEIIESIWTSGIPALDEAVITNVRHKNALDMASESLQKSIESLDQDLSPEFIAVELRDALDALGLIIGKTTTDDILDQIFSKFCIGK